MSELDGRKTEELADLLWERQGRPQNRAAENWMEAEYQAHPPTVLQPLRDLEKEVDLRMRGLGPLTLDKVPATSEGANQSQPARGSKHGLFSLAFMTGVGLLLMVGTAVS